MKDKASTTVAQARQSTYFSPDQCDALFAEWRDTGSAQAYEALLLTVDRLVCDLAWRLYRTLPWDGVGYVEAPDLASEGRLAVAKALPKYNPNGGRTWPSFAALVAKNRILSYHRDCRRSKRRPDAPLLSVEAHPEALKAADPKRTPYEYAATQEERELLRRAFNALTPEERAAAEKAGKGKKKQAALARLKTAWPS